MQRQNMRMIRTLIVDDEPLAREGIRLRLEQDPQIEVLAECSSGVKAVSAIERYRPDLVFLDIQMPKLDGFGVIDAIGIKQMPQVIFVTAYDQYAVKAFQVHALDYLLKPIDSARFDEALAHAKSQLEAPNLETLSLQLQCLLENFKNGKKYFTRIPIKTAGRFVLVNVEQINWFEADDNYVKLHLSNDTHHIHTTLSHLDDNLDPELFLRIHRSIVVNLKQIKEVSPLFQGKYQIFLSDGTQLVSGPSYREYIQQLIGANE